jgi:DNA repair protein RecO (recombination protein O)
MIRKTEAIVLNTRKFGDSSLICTLYTRAFGRRNFIVKGYRSTRSRKRHSYFQPMSLIEVVYYHKEGRDLQLITESTNRYFFQTLQTSPIKITLGMVVIEMFYHTVKEEEEANAPLFEFLSNFLVELDRRDHHLIHLFLFYLMQLSAYVGFFPSDLVEDVTQPVHFDIRNGILENSPLPDRAAFLALAFARTDIAHCADIPVTQQEKNELIAAMMEYYRIHVEGFKVPESLGVFQEIFSN